jgi:hypothetical protein
MPVRLTEVPTLKPPTDVEVETPDRLTEAPALVLLPTDAPAETPERPTEAPAPMPPARAPADMPPRPTDAPAERPPLLLLLLLLLLDELLLDEPPLDDELLPPPLPRPPRPPPPRPSASAGNESANVTATAVAMVFMSMCSSLAPLVRLQISARRCRHGSNSPGKATAGALGAARWMFFRGFFFSGEGLSTREARPDRRVECVF